MKDDPRPRSQTRGAPGQEPKQTRNSAETKEKILTAAIEEFCTHSYMGANTTRIVHAAGCNIRMLYHYFENKEGLYLAALTRVYQELRLSERATNFWSLPPRDGIVALTHFTFDYMHKNPRFARMVLNENFNMGRAVGHVSEAISTASKPFIDRIDALLERGYAEKAFTHRPEALQLYLTILALSFIHVSNAYTLRATFGVDLGSEAFLAKRKAHVTDVVLGYLVSSCAA